MEEVREMRRKISEEFGHDLSRLVAYYQELETEMRKSGKYRFADPPSEKPESEEDVFDSLVSVSWHLKNLRLFKHLPSRVEYLLET